MKITFCLVIFFNKISAFDYQLSELKSGVLLRVLTSLIPYCYCSAMLLLFTNPSELPLDTSLNMGFHGCDIKICCLVALILSKDEAN